MNPTPPIDKTAKGQNESLSLEFDLPHATEKVWRALTDPALLAVWLLPVFDHRLEPGAAFTFKTQPQPGWDGIVNCRMLEIDAHRKIAWRWVVGDIDTVVTFTITPLSGEVAAVAGTAGTRLSIVQSGFKPDQKQAFGGARYGWKMMGGQLVDLLARIP